MTNLASHGIGDWRDLLPQITEAIRAQGWEADLGRLEPGRTVHFSTSQRRGDDSGRVSIFADGRGWWAKDWRSGWSASGQLGADTRDLSPQERAERTRELRSEREAIQARERGRASAVAKDVWAAAAPATAANPYLARKRVPATSTLRIINAGELARIIGYPPQSRGERLEGEILLAAVGNRAQGMTSLEFIDGAGRKAGLAGGARSGSYWAPRSLNHAHSVYVAEGVATCLSINATLPEHSTCVAALSCGNFEAAGRAIREALPNAALVVCGDLGNGEQAALDAAEALGCRCWFPTPPAGFAGTDFNDVAVAGIDIRPMLGLGGTTSYRAPATTLDQAPEMQADPDPPAAPLTTSLNALERDRLRSANARPEPFSQNHVGAELIRQHGHNIRHCAGLGWLHWNGSYWDRNEGSVLALAHGIGMALAESLSGSRTQGLARSLCTPGYASAALAFAATQPATRVDINALDADAWALNTPMGLVNMRTGEIRPARPEDYCTRITSVSPSLGSAGRSDLAKFLREVSCEDQSLVDWMQEALGYSCTADVSLDFFQFWTGSKRNGKNTLGEGALHALGTYAVALDKRMLMVTRNPQHAEWLANLHGRRLAVSSEADDSERFDESLLKSLTGDEFVSARYMYQGSFTFRRTHKHLIFGNSRPTFNGSDGALVERLRCVPFDAYFGTDVNEEAEPIANRYPQDPLMRGRFKGDLAPALLAWMIEGVARLHGRSMRFNPCARISAAGADYAGAMDTFKMFLDENTVIDESESVQSSRIYQRFKRWKERRGEGVMSAVRFAEEMKRQGKEKEIRRHMAYWKGLKLNDEEPDESHPVWQAQRNDDR